jgi:bifunctional non-homologous end joining protein LigD
VLRKSPFIIPSAPVLAKAPPVGREWVHEVKFDGWRAQLHKAGADVVIYTRNGNDVTRRFRGIAAAMATKLQASSAIIDAELVACDVSGAPNFYALMGGAKHGCCAWCFDLLEFNGRVLTAARSMNDGTCCASCSSARRTSSGSRTILKTRSHS